MDVYGVLWRTSPTEGKVHTGNIDPCEVEWFTSYESARKIYEYRVNNYSALHSVFVAANFEIYAVETPVLDQEVKLD